MNPLPVTTSVTILQNQNSAPSNPPTGYTKVYVDNSGDMHALAHDGTDTPIGGGGSLTPPAILTNTDPAIVPFTVVAAADQTANLFAVQNSDGDVIAAIDSVGDIYYGNLYAANGGSSIYAGYFGQIGWGPGSASYMVQPSDGVIALFNKNGDGFTSLQFGPADSSHPMLKVNGSGIDLRLADDSGYTDLTLKDLELVAPESGYSEICDPASLGSGNNWKIKINATALNFNIPGTNTMNFSANGTLKLGINVTCVATTVPIWCAFGSAATPGYAFWNGSGGTTSGMFLTADHLGFSYGGSEQLGISGNGIAIGGGAPIKKFLTATTTWDPASTAIGAMTSTTITVSGAQLGDTVLVSFSNAVPAGCVLSGQVTANDTVTVTLLNFSGSTQDLASGTLRADVIQH